MDLQLKKLFLAFQGNFLHKSHTACGPCLLPIHSFPRVLCLPLFFTSTRAFKYSCTITASWLGIFFIAACGLLEISVGLFPFHVRRSGRSVWWIWSCVIQSRCLLTGFQSIKEFLCFGDNHWNLISVMVIVFFPDYRIVLPFKRILIPLRVHETFVISR